MLSRAIKRYFLRIYAHEIARSSRSAHWSPFAEALFQTVFVTIIPISGLVAAAIVALSHSALGTLVQQQRFAITVGSAVVFPLAAYLFVRRQVQAYRNSPHAAAPFATSRDRFVSNVQFWSVLLMSIALPWAAFLFTKIV